MHFILTNIELFLFIGINPEEKEHKQNIVLNIEWDLEDSSAPQTDDIKDTVDYFAVREFVLNYPQNRHFNLIEYFLNKLQIELINKFPDMENLKIELEKFPFKEGGSIKASIS